MQADGCKRGTRWSGCFLQRGLHEWRTGGRLTGNFVTMEMLDTCLSNLRDRRRKGKGREGENRALVRSKGSAGEVAALTFPFVHTPRSAHTLRASVRFPSYTCHTGNCLACLILPFSVSYRSYLGADVKPTVDARCSPQSFYLFFPAISHYISTILSAV